MKEINWKRISFFGIALIAGLLGATYGQPLIHGNERAINVIVTFFSILAGFLIAIMTIMGDPSGLGGRSWRYAEAKRSTVFRRLVRQKWMFFLYLFTLSMILAASLLEKEFPNITIWMERIYLGAAITALILSVGLPMTLMNIQIERHEEAINAKRKKAGIKAE